jgi:hypothetical protein
MGYEKTPWSVDDTIMVYEMVLDFDAVTLLIT